MLTATRTEDLHTLNLMMEKKHMMTRHTPLASQSTYQPVPDGDSQHLHPKMDTTAERGVVMVMTKTPDDKP